MPTCPIRTYSAIALADEAASAGAEGVLLMPPIYFRYDQETVWQYFLDFLTRRTASLPAYLYNIPAYFHGDNGRDRGHSLRPAIAGLRIPAAILSISLV